MLKDCIKNCNTNAELKAYVEFCMQLWPKITFPHLAFPFRLNQIQLLSLSTHFSGKRVLVSGKCTFVNPFFPALFKQQSIVCQFCT